MFVLFYNSTSWPQSIAAHFWQTAQLLGCLHLQHLLEMLLGLLDVAASTGEGEAVHGLRVLGIDLQGAGQVVESPQAVSFLAEDGAQVLEGHGVPGIGGKSLHGVFLRPREDALFLVGHPLGVCRALIQIMSIGHIMLIV